MQTVSIETSKHAATTAKKQRSAPLEPQVADRLLDLLSSDDAFRRLFKRNPGKALTQVGFVESTVMPSPEFCFFGITRLAPKTQIAEAREAIKAMLTDGLAYTTPNLDTGNNTARHIHK